MSVVGETVPFAVMSQNATCPTPTFPEPSSVRKLFATAPVFVLVS